jgi:glycosyltransferase involved in cell wall biosynthesis
MLFKGSAADVFVLPSAKKKFGIAAAESMAAGIPTNVSEGVGLSSDILSHDASMIVNRDPHSWAAPLAICWRRKKKQQHEQQMADAWCEKALVLRSAGERAVRALSTGHFQEMN